MGKYFKFYVRKFIKIHTHHCPPYADLFQTIRDYRSVYTYILYDPTFTVNDASRLSTVFIWSHSSFKCTTR